MRVAVLYNIPDKNATKVEAEILAELEVLETVEGVRVALEKLGFDAVPLLCSVDALLALKRFDVVFNLAEGFENDLHAEPAVVGAFELLGISYTGSPREALELCRNKHLSKHLLEDEGIPTPRFQLFRKAGDPIKLNFPVIVKPALEDASIGITSSSVARSRDELEKNVSWILETYDQPALVEEYIDGREINASVILKGDQAHVLPLSEIIFDLPPEMPRILGFDSKWQEESACYKGTMPRCPAELVPELEQEIKDLAERACHILGVRGYARVDFRLKGDEAFVIEVNPNPCINPKNSGFARSASAEGMDYTQLVEKILNTASVGDSSRSNEYRVECFESNGFRFKRVRASDASLLLKWFNDSELTKYMEPWNTIPEEELKVRLLNSNDEDFMVCAGDQPMGFVSLYNMVGCTAEISYMIGEAEFRGRGLSKKILESTVAYGFNRLGLISVFASSATENLSSIRALEGAGFKRIGVRRACSSLGGRLLDYIMFDITREDLVCREKSEIRPKRPQ